MSNRAIVPVKLSLIQADVYTLWAPSWRENGAEWQAFLGDDTHILGFHSPEELLVFLEQNNAHDLVSHPKWNAFAATDETRVVPNKRDSYDIVGLPSFLAGRPSYENVAAVAGIFELTQALGNVGGAEDVNIFFASHSILRTAERGAEHFSGPAGQDTWTTIGQIVLENWAKVTSSLDEMVRIVDTAEFTEADTTDAAARIAAATEAAAAAKKAVEEARAEEAEKADPYDTSVWAQAGIDPIKISIQGRTLYTLRTYIDGVPLFLGKFGEINTFPSTKQLVHWIRENTEHDLASVSTWEEITIPAQAGELEVTVHADNLYSFTGLSDDILAGPEKVDAQQMNRAYELMADAADWAGDDSLNEYLLANPRFQDYLGYMLGSPESAGYVPTKPYDDKAQSWKELEDTLIKRFSKF